MSIYIPSPATKKPRMFFPCPSNDETLLEPGMIGIKSGDGGDEFWYKPFKNLVGDADTTPIELSGLLSSRVLALESGTTNYQLVTTATADILVTTSIVGIDCDTIGAACTLTALTAGLVAGRKITVIAFGTDINTVSVVGEGGEYFNETETSVEITNDNRTLVLSVVNGGYNVVNPADAQSIWEKDIVEITDTMPTLGPDFIPDGDMEESGIANWTAVSGGVPTKDSAVFAVGTQSLKINTLTGDDAGGAQQATLLTVGDEYLVEFWCRRDTAESRVSLSIGSAVFEFDLPEASTWYYFSKKAVCTLYTYLCFYGLYDAADTDYDVWIDGVTVRKVEAAPPNSLVPTYRARQNDIIHANDLTQTSAWQLSLTVAGGPQDIISDTTSNVHYRWQRIVATIGERRVFGAEYRPMYRGFVRAAVYDGASYLRYVYVDLSTLDTGGQTLIDDCRVTYTPDGWVRVEIEVDSIATADPIFRHYPAVSLSSATLTGDDTTVDLLVRNSQSYPGRIGDVEFIDNGASTYPLTIKQETRDDFQLRHANGQVLTASGAWEFTEDVDGYLMDESPSNVEAMQQAGLIKNVDNDTWTATPVDGELYRPRGSNDYELLQYVDGNAAGQEDGFYWRFRYVTTAATGTASGSVSINSPVVLEENTSMLLNVSVMAVFRDRQGIIIHNFTVKRGYDAAEMGPETESFNTIEGLAGIDSAGVSMAFAPGYPTGTVNVDFTHENVSASAESVIEWWVEIKGPKFTDVSDYC